MCSRIRFPWNSTLSPDFWKTSLADAPTALVLEDGEDVFNFCADAAASPANYSLSNANAAAFVVSGAHRGAAGVGRGIKEGWLGVRAIFRKKHHALTATARG